MSVKESDMEAGALEQLSALRERLALADPGFSDAARVEQDAEAFCQNIRDDLKRYRLDKGFHQRDLARLLDLSQSAISKVENGKGDLSLKTLYRLSDDGRPLRGRLRRTRLGHRRAGRSPQSVVPTVHAS